MEGLQLDLPDRGALFVISGPSGVGKSTLLATAMARVPGLRFSVSATTRSPRPGELDGRDYHFLAPDRFAALVREGAFLEHATVYDRAYGTLRAPVEEALAGGTSVVLDIDVQGARQVREAFPSAVFIYILPPDLGVLEQRLEARGTESAEARARRMAQVGEQLRGVEEFDFVVVNDNLQTAREVLQAVFLAELSTLERRGGAVRRVLQQLDGLGL